MRKCLLATLLLLALVAHARAQEEEGTVTEVTTDSIKIQQEGVKTLTFQVSNELLTNSVSHNSDRLGGTPAKFPEVKKGDKIDLLSTSVNGTSFCVAIVLRRPTDAGVVTEVGPDTITLRNDKDITFTYKVDKELLEGHDRNNTPRRYSPLYPSRFSEVKPGRRIEFTAYPVYGIPTIHEVNVMKEKEKGE